MKSFAILCLLTSFLFPARSTAAETANASIDSKPGKKVDKVPVLPKAPEGVRILQDLSYLEPGREEKLDLYLPTDMGNQARHPGVIIIHGGGWKGGYKSAAREFNIGTTLAKAGYVCASVEYLKQGPGLWPTNLFDCKNAVRFLRKHAEKYRIDPEHIGVIGGSAGGHLALMVAYSAGVSELSPDVPYPGIPDNIQACVDMYGIANLLTRQGVKPDGSSDGKLREAGLFPEKRGENEAKWKQASPVCHVSKTSPPTLILQGTADTTVGRDQSKELASKLAAAGVPHELVLLPEIGHTFDLQTWNHKPLPRDLRPVVIGFFDKYLRRAP